jgi:hypothetical protein
VEDVRLKNNKNHAVEADDESWRAILEDVDLKCLPMTYLRSISVTFDDDRVCEIDLARSRKSQSEAAIEQEVSAFFEEHEDRIHHLDFQLDFHKIKRHVSKRVSKFLKLNR